MNEHPVLNFAANKAISYDVRLVRDGGTPTVAPGAVTAWPAARKRHLKALKSVVKSGKYHRVNHPIVTAVEESLAAWSGGWDVRAVGSGTSALHIEFDYFRREGGKVITAAYNWPGAVSAIAFSGMEPEFVDVDLNLAAIDDKAAIQKLDAKTGVLLITHLFGSNVRAPELRAAARKKDMVIVDDVSQSISAAGLLDDDKTLDSDALALSANGAKHLGAGELGFILTRDPALIKHVDYVSLATSSRNGERVFAPVTLGHNYRPNVFSAAVAASRIERLDGQLAKRRRNAEHLWRSVGQLDGLLPLFDPNDLQHSYLALPLRIDTEQLGLPDGPAVRDLIVDLLKAEGVPVWVWLTKPVFEFHPAWSKQWSVKDFPNSRKLADTMFYVTEVAPPNDLDVMNAFANAFEKVWHALPGLKSEIAKLSKQ